jgi:hypothetical protein
MWRALGAILRPPPYEQTRPREKSCGLLSLYSGHALQFPTSSLKKKGSKLAVRVQEYQVLVMDFNRRRSYKVEDWIWRLNCTT